MVSKKQFEANRRNATRSTGPITESGKCQSRRNACKHGLTAEKLLVADEQPEAFEEFRQQLIDELAPHSMLAQELVERVVTITWRLRRVAQFEAAILATRVHEVETFDAPLMGSVGMDSLIETEWPSAGGHRGSHTSGDTVRADSNRKQQAKTRILGAALVRDARDDDALGKVLRYETRLTNMLERTLKQLKLLQAGRGTGDGHGNRVVNAVALPPQKPTA